MKRLPVVRRAIAVTAMILLAAGGAHAQVTSESLQPPPGDAGAYDAPPDQSYGDESYGGQSQGNYGAPVEEEADPGDNPYADPAAAGVYDPTTRSTTGPTPLPGPGGVPSYNPQPAPRSAPPAYGRSAPPSSAAPPAYNQAAPRSYAPGAPPGGAQGPGDQAGVRSSCDDVAAELERFRGPPDNPMRPRDEACASARASAEPGRPNPAFRQCSDDFFRQYEQKREDYRRCMEQDAGKGEQRLEQRALTEDAARNGYGGTAPQMAGRYARSGSPGWLGVQVAPVSPQSAYRLGAEGTEGAYVLNAVIGSPAQQAGLRRGDIIVAFDGQAIAQPKDLQYQAERLQAGQAVRLEILRAGKRETLDVQITQRP